jgi:hypothetical protein
MRVSDKRRIEREAQTRSWAAPLPDFSSMPRSTEAPRMRFEWDTRDTANNRLWSDIQITGPKAITSAMVSNHPTSGANTMNPTVSRQDTRSYLHDEYFPSSIPRPGESHQRPTLPTQTYSSDNDQNSIRAFNGVVKEDNSFRTEDRSARIMERNFTHQWLSPEATKHIVQNQIQTAELLRPKQDDYRVQMNH